MNHDGCLIGSKVGVEGAFCFTHAVPVTRVGSIWNTATLNRRSS